MYIINRKDSPWSYLNIDIQDERIISQTVKNKSFKEGAIPTFLYINIIENSYINGKQSRILITLPFTANDYIGYFEPGTLPYIPIEVTEYSEMVIELYDLNGRLVKFNQKYKTIISLNISPI